MSTTQDTDDTDSFGTDTATDLTFGDVLTVAGELRYVIGVRVFVLGLPRVYTVGADGARTLIVADDEVAFEDRADDGEFPDDAKTDTDRVAVGNNAPRETVGQLKRKVDCLSSRQSPTSPDWGPGLYWGGHRFDDGLTVEVYHDTGWRTVFPDGYADDDDVESEREYYADPLTYAYVRDDVDTSPATVPTRSLSGSSDDTPVEIEGVYVREDGGKYSALAGDKGHHGWWSPTEIAAFMKRKVGGDDPHGFVKEDYRDRIVWHDRGRGAEMKFKPAER